MFLLINCKAPGKPTQFKVDDQSAQTITLSWEPVDDCEVNGDIKRYTLNYVCTEVDRRDDVGKNNITHGCTMMFGAPYIISLFSRFELTFH